MRLGRRKENNSNVLEKPTLFGFFPQHHQTQRQQKGRILLTLGNVLGVSFQPWLCFVQETPRLLGSQRRARPGALQPRNSRQVPNAGTRTPAHHQHQRYKDMAFTHLWGLNCSGLAAVSEQGPTRAAPSQIFPCCSRHCAGGKGVWVLCLHEPETAHSHRGVWAAGDLKAPLPRAGPPPSPRCPNPPGLALGTAGLGQPQLTSRSVCWYALRNRRLLQNNAT